MSAERVLALLRDRGLTLAVAESLTGGLLTDAFVRVPGASTVLVGGVTAYATGLKHGLLGVDGSLLAAEGPVHPLVAAQMAEGVRHVLAIGGRPADAGVSTTGVAGPGPQDGHPAGTVHIAVATPGAVRVESAVVQGDRSGVRAAATDLAVAALLGVLLEQE